MGLPLGNLSQEVGVGPVGGGMVDDAMRRRNGASGQGRRGSGHPTVKKKKKKKIPPQWKRSSVSQYILLHILAHLGAWS